MQGRVNIKVRITNQMFLGEQFTSYARQLRDNAKVLVGTYRLEALEKAGKDAGLSSITKERGDK